MSLVCRKVELNQCIQQYGDLIAQVLAPLVGHIAAVAATTPVTVEPFVPVPCLYLVPSPCLSHVLSPQSSPRLRTHNRPPSHQPPMSSLR